MKTNTALDATLQRAIDTGAVPGVVALAADENSIVYEGAAGVREAGKASPMTLDTVVWLASMTKAVTGAAAMQMVERGKLDLDRPAGDVLPALANVKVFEGFDSHGKPQLRAAKGTITLRNLLSHSSGFTYSIWNPTVGQYDEAAGVPMILAGTHATIDVPLYFDPDTRWDYGPGIDWAGRMVEEASGQKLGDYLQENLFGPMGMDSTGFDITPAMRLRLASMHARTPDGGIAPYPLEMPQNAEMQAGGHALYSTMPDYLKFARMILAGGRAGSTQVLKAETVKVMGQNQIGNNLVTTLKTAIPPFSADADFYPGIPCKWGLSFLINTQTSPEGRSAGSLSWAGLCNAYFWVDPVKKVCGVWAGQLLPFFDAKAISAFRDYESAFYLTR